MDYDYEFDAPQFFDFEHPTEYEQAYNDSWFDRHTEDDTPSTDEKPKYWKSASCGNLGKARRVLRGTTDDLNVGKHAEVTHLSWKAAAHAGKARRVPAGEKTPENSSSKSQPSPQKRQKMSPEDEENNSNIVEKIEQIKSETMEPVKSPVKRHAASPKNPRKSPRRSPRLAVKSPYKASKTGDFKASSPKPGSALKKNNLRMASKFASTSTLSVGAHTSRPLRSNQQHQSTTDLKGKTTEEIELEKIAEKKRELARQRKQMQESYIKSMKSEGYVPVRSGQPVTLPQGFHFKTDGRLKNPNGPVKEMKLKSFTGSLREALPQTENPHKTVTRPQPFKLSHAKSSSSLPGSGRKYESAAEKVIAFHKRTPDRFKSHPSNAKQSSKPLSGSKCSAPSMTVAKTPTLTTKGRSRPVHAITQEEKEQMEFEEHQKLRFKAHPLNHKILEKGDMGVPKVAAKAITVPEEFNLHHKKAGSMIDLRPHSEETEEHKFHAKPVNPKILQGTVGVRPVAPLPPTVPQSPAFALKNRVRIPVEVPQVEEPKVTVKANPVPHPGIPFRPRLQHHHTVPEPFSVEERSKRMLTRREEKIQHAFEEERKAREFHARPLPAETSNPLPPKQEKGPTVAEPFQLSSDTRGQRYKEEFMAKVQEEERKLREAAQFRAKPATVTHKDPFQPQKSNRPLTEISDFALNTDVRAVEREEFENQIKEREAQLEGQKRVQQEMKEREELERQARMRQAAVHKATGVKRYKSLRVKPSDKKLTDAHSPKFSQRSRRHNMSDL